MNSKRPYHIRDPVPYWERGFVFKMFCGIPSKPELYHSAGFVEVKDYVQGTVFKDIDGKTKQSVCAECASKANLFALAKWNEF